MELNFKSYTGTKTVKAMPICANKAKSEGANVPEKYFEVGNASYNPGADGYLVEYEGGYRSWSPASAFETAYRVSETHVDRMKIELADLNERICKATRAINAFGTISEEERWYLKKQLEAMQMYADSLHDRIRHAVEPRVSSELGCCNAATMKGGE